MYVLQKYKEDILMIIEYSFVTGEKVKVNVPINQEVESFLEESNRIEENYARNQRRHNYSLDV